MNRITLCAALRSMNWWSEVESVQRVMSNIGALTMLTSISFIYYKTDKPFKTILRVLRKTRLMR